MIILNTLPSIVAQLLVFFGIIFGIIYIVSKIFDFFSTLKEEKEETIRQKKIKEIKELAAKKAAEEKERKRHQYIQPNAIDLGLKHPILWSDINLCASIASPHGEWFCWGTATSTNRHQHNELYTNSMNVDELKQLFSNTTGSFSGLKGYDAATTILGPLWRTPTEEEVRCLIEECNWELTSKDGVTYWKVIGPNGNYILLPAAPKIIIPFTPSFAEYWTSSPSLTNSHGKYDNSIIYYSKMLRIFEINDDIFNCEGGRIEVKTEDRFRDNTAFIRPVMNKNYRII